MNAIRFAMKTKQVSRATIRMKEQLKKNDENASHRQSTLHNK